MVSKIYKYFSSLFKSKEKISFEFVSDTKDIVKVSINYSSINSPEYAASVIYALNNGLFLDKIVNILLNDLSNKTLASNILGKLDALYIVDQQDDLIIKPLEAFDKNVK